MTGSQPWLMLLAAPGIVNHLWVARLPAHGTKPGVEAQKAVILPRPLLLRSLCERNIHCDVAACWLPALLQPVGLSTRRQTGWRLKTLYHV